MSHDLIRLHICAAGELTRTVLRNVPVATVLSLEDPGRQILDALLAAEPTVDMVQKDNVRCNLGYAPELARQYDYIDTPGMARHVSDGLRAEAAHARAVRQHVQVFYDIDNPDHPQGPKAAHVDWVRERTRAHLRDHADAGLIIQCAMGKSRSPALGLAALLTAHEVTGAGKPEPAAVVATLAALRPKATPNLLLVKLTDEAFGYRGTLVQAVRDDPVLGLNMAAVAHDRMQPRIQTYCGQDLT